MNRPETTAQGFFTYADAYAGSARSLIQSAGNMPHGDAPVRLLAFHAIELYLKSFLRCLGYSSDALAAQPFAHNLNALLKAADGRLALAAVDLDLLSDERLSASAIQSRYLAPSAPKKLIVEADFLCALSGRLRTTILDHPDRKGQIIVRGERAEA